MNDRWHIWIDRGGTFTDALGRSPAGGPIRTAKVPSSDRAPVEACRALLGLSPEEPVPPCDIRMGTTVATNALLERAGAKTAMVLTEGFEDLLRIGTQARPDLFDLDIHQPPPLYRRVVATQARATPGGKVLAEPDDAVLLRQLEAAVAAGLESLAICVVGGFAAPELEARIAALGRAAGFPHVVQGHQAAAGIGLLARAQTALLDAYLTPLLLHYLETLQRELVGSRLWLMQSAGGLCSPERFRGPAAVLSGPAGGVVAAEKIARQHGFAQTIGFDMGGTSTDVSRIGEGGIGLAHEGEVDGIRFRAPMVDIHTVAAGGGSVCHFDGEQFQVGPASTGADPGPLCYGNAAATQLAVTDLNVVTGRLVGDRFPFALDGSRARQALLDIGLALGEGGLAGVDGIPKAEQVAEGFLAVANAHMASAIEKISVARGYDVREHVLTVFGGAGGQHACDVARRLGVRQILMHPWAGLLSAWGMGLAPTEIHRELDAGRVLLEDDSLQALTPRAQALIEEARQILREEGAEGDVAEVEASLALRYRGSDTALEVAWTEGDSAKTLRQGFEEAHLRELGHRRAGADVEIHALRVTLKVPGAGAESPPWPEAGTLEVLRRQRVFVGGRWVEDVPIVARESCASQERLKGPALIVDDAGAVWLAEGFTATVASDGTLLLVDEAPAPSAPVLLEKDPVQLALFAGAFQSIAEQMGEALRRTALSVNIKERLDFSCALFDATGNLVANAPHIPVHLGAMAETVKAVVKAHPDPEPGDAFVSNDPAAGGSHLPDITVVTPVFDAGGVLCFFTASRGHHSDVGGVSPGSMPPFATTLDEEGAVFRALPLARGGVLQEDAVREVLTGGKHPARDPDQNLADLGAQLAANQTGARLLLELTEARGLPVVVAYMRHVQSYAAERVRRAIASRPDGWTRFEDTLDDGTPIVVEITVEGDQLRLDFTGTGPSQASNLNAPRAVTMAAVLYAIRVLAGTDLPLCSGCLEPVEVVVPEGCLLDPEPWRAVSGGNVETSQRVVDVLLGGLGLCAASQGTMNNLTLGNERFGYYETIAGGAGATERADGAHGVHTHMTNTRITDAEILEERYPIRLRRFRLRTGSGGGGRQRGGDGIERTLVALEPLHGAIVSQRRSLPPFGIDGGRAGSKGRNLVRGEPVPGCVEFDLDAGDEVTLLTPGGGGFGLKE